MVIIALSLLFAVVGAFLYVAASNPKVAELGKIMFFCGLLSFLMRFAVEHVHFGS